MERVTLDYYMLPAYRPENITHTLYFHRNERGEYPEGVHSEASAYRDAARCMLRMGRGEHDWERLLPRLASFLAFVDSHNTP